jgi:hypothetical protein
VYCPADELLLSGGWTLSGNGYAGGSLRSITNDGWEVFVGFKDTHPVTVAVYAVCLRNAPAGTQVIQRATFTTVPSSGTSTAVVPCASGERAVGGGFMVTREGLVYSSAVGGTAWEVEASNPSAGDSGLYATAMCLKSPGVQSQFVVGSRVLAPPSSQPTAQVDCPTGSVLAGGGLNINQGLGDSPLSTVHIVGSSPASDPDTPSTTTWDAAGYNSSASTAWSLQAGALCLSFS